jgi:hypothetical protein
MTTKPKPRKEPSAASDPIFAAIGGHKARTKEWTRLLRKLDEAEVEAEKTHGQRPWPWIAWRNYEAIGESEIDNAHEEFVKQPGADRKQVGKEYRDAKARLAAAERAGVE